jgi:glycosyltransferase involved in cell wall biosynthesis
MRIALIGPAHPYKGGGALHTTELAHRLAAAGHDVVIESWRALYPAFLYPGVQTVGVADAEPYPRTRRLLSWRRPDGWWRAGRRLRGSCDLAVFAYLAPVQVPPYLGIIAGLRRRPARPGSPPPRVVVICHNVLPHERRPGDVLLTRALLRRADAVLTHTERLAPVARSLAPGTPVAVADLPPHLPVTAAGSPPLPGRDPRRLLFFGIVRPYKGLDVLLRALAAGPPQLTLTVAGEFWGGVGATRELVSELGLGARVELRPGYVAADEIGTLLGQADALVLPYRSATSSQNAWLAFAHGVPVIATRTGTFAEQVTDGVDGLLCAPGDVAELTEALARFCAPVKAARLRAGVRPVDSRPLWEAYLKALLALASPGPPPPQAPPAPSARTGVTG